MRMGRTRAPGDSVGAHEGEGRQPEAPQAKPQRHDLEDRKLRCTAQGLTTEVLVHWPSRHGDGVLLRGRRSGR